MGRLTVIPAQVQNCFDELKRAWEGRKSELEVRLKALGGAGLFGGGGGGYGAMYNNPAQQYAQMESVSRFVFIRIPCIISLTTHTSQMVKDAGLHVGKFSIPAAPLCTPFAHV